MESIDHLSRLFFPWAVAWCLAILALRTWIVLRRGYQLDLGTAKGSPRRGILYSLTFSMLPWKKDSTRRHPWTYGAGMGMHLGIFATFLYAVGGRFWTWPPYCVPIFGAVAGLGFASTLGLFVKRNTRDYMKAISSPDDFLSNALVQLWLGTACLAAFVPGALALWRLAAVLLLVYLPVGKIYHMLLFFVSRTLFGLQFGRRGVLRHDFPISY